MEWNEKRKKRNVCTVLFPEKKSLSEIMSITETQSEFLILFRSITLPITDLALPHPESPCHIHQEKHWKLSN